MLKSGRFLTWKEPADGGMPICLLFLALERVFGMFLKWPLLKRLNLVFEHALKLLRIGLRFDCLL